MFIIFCVLEALVLACAWGIFLWLWTTNADLPEVSSYPVIDFTMKAQFLSANQRGPYSESEQRVEGADVDWRDELDRTAGDTAIRKLLGDRMVVMRSSRAEKGTSATTPLQMPSEGTIAIPSEHTRDDDTLEENSGSEHGS
jgi:hypothetical protein